MVAYVSSCHYKIVILIRNVSNIEEMSKKERTITENKGQERLKSVYESPETSDEHLLLKICTNTSTVVFVITSSTNKTHRHVILADWRVGRRQINVQ